MKNFTKDYITKNKNYCNYKNLICDDSIIYADERKVYLGMDQIKWYEYCDFADINAVSDGLDYLKENDYGYIFSCIGDENEDYTIKDYHSDRLDEPYLEYPLLVRYFDDKSFIETMKNNNNDMSL